MTFGRGLMLDLFLVSDLYLVSNASQFNYHPTSFSGDLSCTSVLQVSNLCPFFLLVPGRMTAEGLLGLVIVAFPGFSITCTYTCNYFPLFSDRVFKIGHLFTPYCEIRFRRLSFEGVCQNRLLLYKTL